MAKAPTSTCRLCQKVRLLCDSHLLPAATFKVLRANTLTNPNPVMFDDESAYTTSKQLTDYLLCSECEERFHKHGEDWVLANCYRNDNSFRILDTLNAVSPKYEKDGVKVYSGATVPGI